MNETTQKIYTVMLTERQLATLKSHVLSQEMNHTRPEHIRYFNDLFLALSAAREQEMQP